MKHILYTAGMLLGMAITTLKASESEVASKKIIAQAAMIKLSQREDVARFEGPYQTPGTTKDTLRKRLDVTQLPEVIINIIASYFFYQQPTTITVYQSKHAEKITKNERGYTFNMTHVNENVILAQEIIGSLSYASGILPSCFALQEWEYLNPQGQIIRSSSNTAVSPEKAYPTTTVHNYTFAIDIPRDYEWTARESLATFGSNEEQSSAEIIAKYSPARCIIA